jgi:hypothetical protein
MEAVSEHQVCRFDSAVARGFSRTVAFKRTKAVASANEEGDAAAAAARIGRAARLAAKDEQQQRRRGGGGGGGGGSSADETLQELEAALVQRLADVDSEIERLEEEEQAQAQAQQR